MVYRIRWHENAVEDLRRLDQKTARAIIKRVTSYLVESPLTLGKSLTGSLKGLFRYRYGKYRVIYTVDQETVLILVLRVPSVPI
ncbi:type II toxin-antitoxin system RelE/ParE family toxin [bacterium]|nr:type II toxin-antitoxin system RelE/ParE family toxin [bacterium]